jgi:hypothetical protein
MIDRNSRSPNLSAALAVLAIVCAYTVSSELYYRSNRLVLDAWGDCRDASTDLVPAALAWIVLTFLASSAYFGRLAGRRWQWRTVSLTLVTSVGGLVAGRSWYGWRMRTGAECIVRGKWCLGSCEPLWWDRDVIRLPILFGIAAILSVLVGAAARRIRPRTDDG